MKNIIAYVRVSTQGQVGDDVYGLEVQKQDVTKYCKDNNLNIVKWYVEEGVSGATLDRPELNKLLSSEISNPPIEAVVVAKTDRVARDVNLYYYIKYNLKKKNIELLSVQDDYSTYGAMGNIMESIIVSFAEFEKNMITTRTSKGRKLKAETGGYAGGRTPFGYDSVEGNLVINEEEAEIVKIIFKNAHLSLRKLADLLNASGLKTAKGAKWYAAQVGYIRNRKLFYQGLYRYGKEEWVTGQHKAILEGE